MGGARTALFNYLFARKHKGQFILRIEDTDKARHQENTLKPLLQNLKWLGLDWDEGPFEEDSGFRGDFGPYRQSERLSIYKSYAEKLIEENKAYYCFLTEAEIETQKEEQKREGKPPKILSPYRSISKTEALKKRETGQICSIRFKTPEGSPDCRIQDLIRGEVAFPSDMAGDFIMVRSDGFPVYNFSCAVDDSLMKISHVFRGEEHLPNTFKQVLIQEALGWTPPQYGHLSLILGEDKKKLSKREGSQHVHDFQKEGYLPEALINFFALLGWNPGTVQEHFSKEDLIKSFSIERVNASPAVFDLNKLSWLNSEHMKSLKSEDFWRRVKPFFEEETLFFNEDSLWQTKAFELLSSGFKTFKQAVILLKPLFKEGFYLEDEAKGILNNPQGQEVIKFWRDNLKKGDSKYLSPEEFKSIQKEAASSLGVKGKAFFQPLRCTILGKTEGMEIKAAIALIKRGELIRRAELVA